MTLFTRIRHALGFHHWVYRADRLQRRCLICERKPQHAVIIERNGERRLLGWR